MSKGGAVVTSGREVIEALLSRPGLYVGSQRDPESASDEKSAVARVLVQPLPGRAGVSLDYEVLSPDGTRPHHEHAVLASTPQGVMMFTAHDHADVASVLHEGQAGKFVAEDGAAPFPMEIELRVPEPGHLVYLWSYGWEGNELRVRDVGDMRVVA